MRKNAIGSYYEEIASGFTFGTQTDQLTLTNSVDIEGAVVPGFEYSFQAKTGILAHLDDINYIETNDNDYTTQLRLRVNNALEELGLLDKEMLLHTHEKSLRKTAKMLDMSYGKVFYQKNLALEKLLKTNGIKEWENER